MQCPICDGKTLIMGGNGTYVEKQAVHRCRKCKDCGLKFVTQEKIDFSRMTREQIDKMHAKAERRGVRV